MLNLTLHFGKSPSAGEEWIRRTQRNSDREYDVVVPVSQLMIRLDPYEQDCLKIEEVDGVIIIQHNGKQVYSTPMIEP